METQSETGGRTGGLKGLWADFGGLVVLVAGILAILFCVAAAAGTSAGAWSWTTGVTLLQLAALAALIALVLGVAVFARRKRHEGSPRNIRLGLGLFAAVLALLYTASWGWAWLTHPKLHDISTALADPPVFRGVPVRQDNFDQVPGAGNDDFAGLNPRQRWAAIHQREYPQIRSVRIDDPPEVVIERAQRIAEARGWNVVPDTVTDSRVELQGRVSALGLPFIASLRTQPINEGTASLIDMRFVAQQGTSDFGILSDTLQTYLADLSGTTTATGS